MARKLHFFLSGREAKIPQKLNSKPSANLCISFVLL